MSNVTFSVAASPLMTPVLGVWNFTPGMMQRDWVFVRLPRGVGEIAKDMGMSGCDHELRLEYLNVAAEDVSGIFDFLQGLWTPAAGSPRSGILTVPDYGSYRHCVVSNCVPDAQALRAKNMTPGSTAGTKVYNLGFALTFRQLR